VLVEKYGEEIKARVDLGVGINVDKFQLISLVEGHL
jgi:hypothetical protein